MLIKRPARIHCTVAKMKRCYRLFTHPWLAFPNSSNFSLCSSLYHPRDVRVPYLYRPQSATMYIKYNPIVQASAAPHKAHNHGLLSTSHRDCSKSADSAVWVSLLPSRSTPMISLSFQTASPVKVLFPRTAQVVRKGHGQNGTLRGFKELGWGVVTANWTKKYPEVIEVIHRISPNHGLCSPKGCGSVTNFFRRYFGWILGKMFGMFWWLNHATIASFPQSHFLSKLSLQWKIEMIRSQVDTHSVCVDAFAAVPVKQCKAKF